MSINRGSSRLWPVLLALVLGAGAGVLFWLTRESRSEAPPPSASQAPKTSVSAASIQSAPSTTGVGSDTSAPPGAEPGAAAAPLLSGEAALEAISDLAATYDAASVPALARYLKHQNPDIRSAARDGLINLGERAAIPFLQEAAKTAAAEEANALREAAEFLALPTWTERREAEKKARAQQAAAGH